LATVSELPELELQEGLARLVDAEIVFPRGVPPDASYYFKHALVQDAAYASLVGSRRRKFHRAIAQALEVDSSRVVVTQPELLAHHYTAAGLLEDAARYWRKAGELALARSGYAEAATHFARGIQVVRQLPAGADRDRQELEFHLPLGPATRAIKGLAAPEVLQVYSRARELIRHSTPLEHQLAAQLGLWTVYWGRAEHTAAHRLAQQCLELAARHQDTQAIARTTRIMGMTLSTMGRFAEARTHLQRSLDLSASNPHTAKFPGHDDRATALSFLAGSLWLMGYLDQARAAASQAVARALDVGQPTTIAFVRYWEAIYGGYGSDPRGAAARTEALVAYCAEHRIASFQHLARFHQGAYIAKCGDFKRGIAIMQDSMASHADAAGRASRPMHLGHLASAQASAGRLTLAVTIVEKAIAEAERTKDKVFLAELYRLRGELLLRSSRKSQGRASLQRAFAVARQQRAKFWELRAATTLAESLMTEGRSGDARDLLAPLSDWFTEGSDVPDLKRARALLKNSAQNLRT
jgi:predicted ATPase